MTEQRKYINIFLEVRLKRHYQFDNLIFFLGKWILIIQTLIQLKTSINLGPILMMINLEEIIEPFH